jgi:AcrR family transcriptional regulator
MEGSTMAAELRTPRKAWIEAGLSALARGGSEAVRAEPLARELGVTKGGFYGHFADRDEFLSEVLDAWERESIDDVVERVEREGGAVRTKLRRAGVLTLSRDRLLPIDLAIRDWARHDPAIEARLRRVDNRRMDYLRSLFHQLHPRAHAADTEARCLLAFALLIGNHFIAAEHPGLSRASVLELAVSVLEEPGGIRPQ